MNDRHTEAGDSYTDAKGRKRWHRNDWLAEELVRLHDFLVIGGYEETHAAVYKRLFYTISRYPEPMDRLHADGRLGEIPDVGPTIAELIGEYLRTGTCAKKKEWAEHRPVTLLEIAEVPGLGAKMARTLYSEHGIGSLDALESALASGRLDRVKGLGAKTREKIARHVAGRRAE